MTDLLSSLFHMLRADKDVFFGKLEFWRIFD